MILSGYLNVEQIVFRADVVGVGCWERKQMNGIILCDERSLTWEVYSVAARFRSGMYVICSSCCLRRLWGAYCWCGLS